MKGAKIKSGLHSLCVWVFVLLFVVVTNCLVYLTSLLDFSEGWQLIFVFSFYLVAYLGVLVLLASAWSFLHKFLVAKDFPGQKILVTYEVTFDEYEKIKGFLSEIRA